MRIVTGPGCLDEIASECERLHARRVLVVTSDSSRSIAERIRAILGPIWGGEFADVVAHVPAAQANAVVANAQEIRADSVLTVGGGSATGLGKIVALALRLPLVSVPTTFTGCEMTALYGVTTARGFETGRDERTRPRAVLHDPALSLGLAPDVTGASGYDAIGSCLDVLWRLDAPRAATSAREGLETLWEVLPSMADDPLDIVARETALLGARAAGQGLDAAGPGLYRRLAWELATLRSCSPAELSGWLLPTVSDFNAPRQPGALGDIAGRPVTDALRDLGKRLGLATDPVGLGYDADDVAWAAARVAADPPPNPTPVSADALRNALSATL